MTFTKTKQWVLGAAMVVAATSAWGQQKVVNVYNWAEYTAPDTISGFEKETEDIKKRI